MNILMIGNGFDLAHGLPTGYPDFLGFCRMINEVYCTEQHANAEEAWDKLGIKLKNEDNTERLKMKFVELYSISCINKDNNCIQTDTIYDELYVDIKDNFWIKYFLQNAMYQKENWIDFESEISKVIQSVDESMKAPVNDPSSLEDEVYEMIDEFVEEYFSHYEPLSDCINEVKCSLDNITYEMIRNKLHSDLNKVIRALEIYLTEYVEKIDLGIISPDIEEIVMQHNPKRGGAISNVLSFNYSNTYERIYLSQYVEDTDKYMDYIHGKASVANNLNANNMVLGIDEYLTESRKNKDVEFIAFKKFYQRIYKETGCKYKDWLEQIRMEYIEYLQKKEDAIKKSKISAGDGIYSIFDSVVARTIIKTDCRIHNLYIYGHSLDVTDGDVLRDLILNDNVYTTIFYLNKDVMGQQIANLVKVIGQDELIRRTGGSSKTIEFKLQRDMVKRK